MLSISINSSIATCFGIHSNTWEWVKTIEGDNITDFMSQKQNRLGQWVEHYSPKPVITIMSHNVGSFYAADKSFHANIDITSYLVFILKI